jgi:arylsulfatase A-like enzyme
MPPGGRVRALWGIAACGLLIGACQDTELSRARAHRASVLRITLDTTRADHLGCYGYEPTVSPNLDRLASQGTLFTQAIAQAAVTPVSHASILTGLNPFSHGLRVMHGVSQNRLSDSRVTLAEVLKSQGYQTAAFVSAFPVSERFGLHQGFDSFDADFLRDPVDRIVTKQGVVNTGANQRHGGDTTNRALRWLDQARTPYFLWVHYFDPHDARVLPPPEFTQRYDELWKSVRGVRDVLRSIYAMEISYMDLQIGRLLDELESKDQLRNMIVVVVADHGEGLGDHDWWTHGILYQEQVRVPLVILAPSRAAGRRVEYVVRTVDVMPTILELVGLNPNRIRKMEGRSLVPLLEGETIDPRYVAYSDSLNMLTYRVHKEVADTKDDLLFSVTQGDWKYIHHLLRTQESELYRLSEDPRELENLIESHPQDATRMRELLDSFDAFPEELTSSSEMSSEDIEQLRALGYIE